MLRDVMLTAGISIEYTEGVCNDVTKNAYKRIDMQTQYLCVEQNNIN